MANSVRFGIYALAIAGFTAIGAASALAQNADEKKIIDDAKSVWGQCRACHQVGKTARNAVGPVLNGMMGRKSGEAKGYNYSAANKKSNLTWDDATFREYIKNPRKKIPGTKMAFAGIKGETADKKIDALIAFLKLYDDKGMLPSERK
ncbi:MAG: cytochrome c family protein [Beijerinckiaceae bacterium]